METAPNKLIVVSYELYVTEDGERDLVEKATKEQRTVNFSQPQFAQHRQALSTQEKTKNVFLQQEANPNKITLH